MAGQGTRTKFSEWLQSMKRLTHTTYDKLPTEKKLAIYKEYQDLHKTHTTLAA